MMNPEAQNHAIRRINDMVGELPRLLNGSAVQWSGGLTPASRDTNGGPDLRTLLSGMRETIDQFLSQDSP